MFSLAGIVREFPGVKALNGASFDLSPGEVLALIGENGAGKSTLVKILTGLYHPDAGTITLDGEPVTFNSPRDAQVAGIGVIHQETTMFDHLSVAENIFAGVQPTGVGGIDWQQMRRRAVLQLERLGSQMDVRRPLGSLSVAQKHVVAIARALEAQSRILIMDEPTASLSRNEIEELLGLVRQLRDSGTAIVFISHKFDEIFDIADRFVVLRDGNQVGQGRIADYDQSRLVAMMVGRAVETIYPKIDVEIGDTVLDVAGYSRVPEFDNVGFSVRGGEILGIYGLVGAGRTELMQSLFGVAPADSGTISLFGKPVTIRSPRDAIDAGIAYVPEDRQAHGVIQQMSIAQNITLPSLARVLRGPLLNRRRENAVSVEQARRLGVKAGSIDGPVKGLSGGNQQKVVLAKWLMTRPRVLLLDEPTKGIDIAAKVAVHELVADIVRAGTAVVLVSSELPEILGLSDRVAVMRKGRLAAMFTRAEATAERVILAATGAAADGRDGSAPQSAHHGVSA